MVVRRALQCVLAGGWLIAGLLAYAAVEGYANDTPLASETTIAVTAWGGSEPAAEIYAELDEVSRDHRMVVAREVDALTGRGTARDLYVAGASVRTVKSAGLATTFGNATESRWHEIRELGNRSPIGRYHLLGSRSDETAVVDLFHRHGMETEASTSLGAWWLVGESRTAVVVVALLVAGTAGAYAVSTTRRQAIHRLHGVAASRFLVGVVAPYVAAWGVSGVCCAAAAAVGLTATGSSVALYLAVMVRIGVLLLASAILAHLIVLGIVSTVPIRDALKGHLPGWSLTIAAYGTRITAAFMALGAIGVSLALTGSLAARADERQHLESLGDYSTLNLGYAYTAEDQERFDNVVGSWIKRLDQGGDVLMAYQLGLAGHGPQGQGETVLIVNDTYVAEQPITLDDGRTIASVRDDALTLIVPADVGTDGSEVVDTLELDTLIEADPRPRVATMRARSDQEYFTYAIRPESAVGASTGSSDEVQTHVVDPIVLVVPASTGWLRNDAYAPLATQEAIIVSSPAAVERSIANDEELQRFVKAVTPIADRVAEVVAEERNQLRSAVFLSMVAIGVLLMSGVAAALIQIRRLGQTAFVRHLHGWRLPSIYRALVVIETALTALVVLWIPYNVASDRREFDRLRAINVIPPTAPPAVSAFQWAAIGATAILLIGGFWLTLILMHRSIVGRRSGVR